MKYIYKMCLFFLSLFLIIFSFEKSFANNNLENINQFKENLKERLTVKEYNDLNNEFLKLSEKDKIKFIDYLNDPNFIEKSLNWEIKDAKIINKKEKNKSNYQTRSIEKYESFTHKINVELLWINVLELKLFLDFYHDWKKITRLLSKDAVVTRNFTIFWDLTFSWESFYIEATEIANYEVNVSTKIWAAWYYWTYKTVRMWIRKSLYWPSWHFVKEL